MDNKIEGRNPEKKQDDFAILVDSCCDVPKEYIEKYPIYVIPLRINYENASYRDRIDITPEEVCDRLQEEIPTTSLPQCSDIKEVFENIVKDGYNKIIAISISSNLSGTFNLVRLVSEELKQQGIQVFQFDTKNIGIGSGMYAVSMTEQLEGGKSFEEAVQQLKAEYGNSKVFFCLETLEYLRKGGRIGRVASLLGTALNIKPIITCGEDGTYVIAAKERGTKKCIDKAIMLVKEFASTGKRAEVMLLHSGHVPGLDKIKEKLEQVITNGEVKLGGQISPALTVHVGPGLIGISVYVTA
jgi:DegV family protein with EDD domain